MELRGAPSSDAVYNTMNHITNPTPKDNSIRTTFPLATMELPKGSREAFRDIMACSPGDITTNETLSSPPAPTPPCDEFDPQKAKAYKPQVFLDTPIPTNGMEETRGKFNFKHNEPSMAASKTFLADEEATAARAAEKPSTTISTASAPTVLADHDEYARQLNADWEAMPAELPYKRSKRDERKSKAKFAERKEKLRKPSWKADLKELDEMAKKLKENQKKWSDAHIMMEKVTAKRKTKKKDDKKYTYWYEKMLAGPWKTSGPTKKLKRTIGGWEEVDIKDDEAEAMKERKQLRKRQFSLYNTWKWNEFSSSDENGARESRVVAEAIRILEEQVDDDDQDDEPIMHSLLSDDEVIAADPPLRTKQEKAMEKTKKQEGELIEKERKAREELRPLLHPFFKGNKHSADHILHAGALPVDVLKKSQFFPVSADIRKAKMALYKQKYEEKIILKIKKDEVVRNRASKKQRRFEARRQKRSDYAHKLTVSGWDFPKDALISYEDAIARAQTIPAVSVEIPKDAPKQPAPSLPLASEYVRDPTWTFPIWDYEMAWIEYDTLPGRFEAISKIIKDDDWSDQFVKGSKLDQDLMHTIVRPVWSAMTYEEKAAVLGGERVYPACFWSNGEDDGQSYMSGSPKMVDPFGVEGSERIRWSHPSKSNSESFGRAESLSESFGEGKDKPATSILCTDSAAFDAGAMNVSGFLNRAMSISSTERASSDEVKTNDTEITQHVRSSLSIEKASSDKGVLSKSASLKSTKSSSNADCESFKEKMNSTNSVSTSGTERAGFDAAELNMSPAIVRTLDSPENSFRNSMESDISALITDEAKFNAEESDETDSWPSMSFYSKIKKAHSNHEGTGRVPDDYHTSAAPENSLSSSAVSDNGEKMPPGETMFKDVDVSDFEEPLDNSNPDLDLNILFQRVGALAVGEEAPEIPTNSTSNREAELIFDLLRKEALVRHWLPRRTFSYNSAAWKARASISDPENKEAVNPAIFPPVVKDARKDIKNSDPERMDLSLPDRNNVLQGRPDMQMNWIGIADEYRIGLNGRQRLTKPIWAKNYDLSRAQQPDPLIYLPKKTLQFEEVGYFSDVLPEPLVFPEVNEGSYDKADWIWQKHCMEQRIGLRRCDQRSDPNEPIDDEGSIGLIGDNLPPEDMSFDATRSIRNKRFNGDSALDIPIKIEKAADVPDEVFAQMLKELEEHKRPIPETEALGRPPPELYIQPDGIPAAVFMKAYQEEYEEFRGECPEPTSIRFDREVYAGAAPVSPQQKAKNEVDDYLALMEEQEKVEFLKDAADFLNELVVPGPDDMRDPSQSPVELTEEMRTKLDFKPKFKVDKLDLKRATEDTAILELNSVFQRTCSPVPFAGSDAGSSSMSMISVALSRRSERYSLREAAHEKPNSRAPLAMHKTPSVSSLASKVRSKKLSIALDASKVRILQKMKDRGDSAEKQASMAATLDSMKHPEPFIFEPDVLSLAHRDEKQDDEKVEMVEEVNEYKPVKASMTPAKARALIDYMIDDAPAMEDDELKENIIRFFGKRLFAYSLTKLDLISIDVPEKEANAYIQQRFEAHKFIENAEEANTKKITATKTKSLELMSEREAQYLFEATMTPAKARTLLDWAKRTQTHLYVKHMLCPGLLEYCKTELDAALVAVTKQDCVKFIAWNMKMRESGQNLMELHRAARFDGIKRGDGKGEFRTLSLISIARGRAIVEWLCKNRPDLEVMELLHRDDLGRIIDAKGDPEAPVTENEAIVFYNLLSKRAMEINHPHRGPEAKRGVADEIPPLFEEQTEESTWKKSPVTFPAVDDSEDGSVFEDTFENDPKMSPALAMQLIAWVLDVKPDCNPNYVLGNHFIRYARQYQGPELEPMEDDEAFPHFKKYAVAQQFRTGRLKGLYEDLAHDPDEHEDTCADVPLYRSGSERSLLGKFADIDCPLGPESTHNDIKRKPNEQNDASADVPSYPSETETSVLEKFPEMEIDSSAPRERTSDTLRLLLKPSQACEFLEYLKSIYGHCDFKDKDFDRMIRAYIKLPDDAPTKDFLFGKETLGLFKQMVKTQIISLRKRQRAFDEGRVAYAYGAGTDPDIRRERGEEIADEVEQTYNPYDDIYDGISTLFGSVSSASRLESPKSSSRGCLKDSFGSSYGGLSNNNWPDLLSEASFPVPRRSNKGIFIRKRLLNTFDPLPDYADNRRLFLRCNTSYHSQHEADRNGEPSNCPLESASPGEFELGLSLPEDEKNTNGPQSPTLDRRHGVNHSLCALATERSSSPVLSSENSDSEDLCRPPLKGRDSRNLSVIGAIPYRARAETPPLSFASCPSGDSYQNSTDWGTGSSSSMTFSQFQALRRNCRLEEANMSPSFRSHEPNPFDEDVGAYNADRDEEDDESSDMEAYEIWYNAKHGITQEELDGGRRYFEEEQMIDEMPDDPEMLEKVLAFLAKIDAEVAAAHAEAVVEARIEEKQTVFSGDIPPLVDDDQAQLLLHTLDPKKAFKKTLLKIIDTEHLDAEETKMLLELIRERDIKTEYEWVDENGDPLEESDWKDGPDEEDDIDQNYHVQEHQERMQLSFEQCEYEGALARVEAWRDAHEEHADPAFPQRERDANEARKAEDKRIAAIIKTYESSKALLTVPHRKRGRRLKVKTLRRKEKASLSSALSKKGETPLLKDQTFKYSAISRRAHEIVSFQVTVEDEPLKIDQRARVAETSIPEGEDLSNLKSCESGDHESKDADIRVRSPTSSLPPTVDDVYKEAFSRTKDLAAHLGFKSKDTNVGAPSPTPSIRSVSHGVAGMPYKKLTKTKKSLRDPSIETLSPRTSMAPSETAPRFRSLVQCKPSDNVSVESTLTKESIKTRLGFKSKDMNTAAPSPASSVRSVPQDLPRRSSKKLAKKRKLDVEDARPFTFSPDFCSPAPSVAPSGSAPWSVTLGQHMNSLFKRKDTEEENNEESGLKIMNRIKSLKLKRGKKDTE